MQFIYYVVALYGERLWPTDMFILINFVQRKIVFNEKNLRFNFNAVKKLLKETRMERIYRNLFKFLIFWGRGGQCVEDIMALTDQIVKYLAHYRLSLISIASKFMLEFQVKAVVRIKY